MAASFTIREGQYRTSRGHGTDLLTMLNCQVGNHRGPFAIERTPIGWCCEHCIKKLPAHGCSVLL